MKPQYSHSLITSMMLWLDYKLVNDEQAFTNYTGQFFPQVDPSITGYAYASPYKGWIYDSCASGVAVNSGMYNSSGQFLTRNSGLYIDYTNGRIVSQYNWGPLASGVYASRDFNLYFSTESEVNFFLEKVYNENPNLTYTLTGSNPYLFYAPCIIFTNAQSENKPWALGGIDESYNSIRAYILSTNNYLQEGVNSYFNDLSRRFFSFASYGDSPLNSLGDLKAAATGGSWCYANNILGQYGYSGGTYINNVANYKMSEKNNKQMAYYLSVNDFLVSQVRTPFLQ